MKFKSEWVLFNSHKIDDIQCFLKEKKLHWRGVIPLHTKLLTSDNFSFFLRVLKNVKDQ